MNITIDEATHVYCVDGRKLPGITSRLKANSMIDDEWFTEESRQRGTAVHLATQYEDDGGLDMSSVDSRLHGYILAWTRWKDEMRVTFAGPPEMLVACPDLGYATRIDRVIRSVTGHTTVVNLKTGVPLPWHPIQLAGELLAYCRTTGERLTRTTRASVYLKADGSYKWQPYKERDLKSDIEVFRAAAILAAWKDANP